MNDDTKDLLVNALAFISTTVITVLAFAFVVFMVKVGVRLTIFAWELV
jgi:hypothetical protein